MIYYKIIIFRWILQKFRGNRECRKSIVNECKDDWTRVRKCMLMLSVVHNSNFSR